MTPRKGKARRRGGGRGGSGENRWVSVALFAALGVTGAFLVSFVAGLPGSGDGSDAAAARDIGDLSEIRVEVLNGAGTAGLAGEATDRLRASGFDVVFFGNASTFDHPRSVVLDRVGDPALAHAVAAALSIDSVASATDSTLLLEVSVVLGGDWPPEVPEPTGLGEQLKGLVGRD